jgi:hypothetical protein
MMLILEEGYGGFDSHIPDKSSLTKTRRKEL